MSRTLRYLFVLLMIASVHAETPNDHARYISFIKEIRCMVCQGQSLAESQAPFAQDLRLKIHDMMLKHQSDQEIKAYLVKRYGEFILLRPRLNTFTLALWFFPFSALLWVLWKMLKTV